jgi:hypothetical protein
MMTDRNFLIILGWVAFVVVVSKAWAEYFH